MGIIKKYGFLAFFQLLYFKIRGFFILKNARLIRFPFRIRGREFVDIDKGFTTGFNCRLDAFNVNNNKNVLIKIGKNVQINDYVHIGAINKIEIHDDVLIASKVFITDHSHGNYSGDDSDSPLTKPNDRPLVSAPVIIKKNVWIGEFVSILPGVTIGEGSIIGTMSVVTKDIPPYCIAVGSPAKVIKVYNFINKNWEAIYHD